MYDCTSTRILDFVSQSALNYVHGNICVPTSTVKSICKFSVKK